MKLKTTSIELQKVWDDLNEIFNNKKRLSTKDLMRLEKLGYRVYHSSKHPKMYIEYKDKVYVITLCSTPSDKNWGRQTLREIRRVYEQN